MLRLNLSFVQQDYVGTQPEEAPEIEKRMAALRTDSTKNYYKDTSMRHSYNEPKVDEHLQGNTTRYGCNSKKHQVNFSSIRFKSDSPWIGSLATKMYCLVRGHVSFRLLTSCLSVSDCSVKSLCKI